MRNLDSASTQAAPTPLNIPFPHPYRPPCIQKGSQPAVHPAAPGGAAVAHRWKDFPPLFRPVHPRCPTSPDNQAVSKSCPWHGAGKAPGGQRKGHGASSGRPCVQSSDLLCKPRDPALLLLPGALRPPPHPKKSRWLFGKQEGSCPPPWLKCVRTGASPMVRARKKDAAASPRAGLPWLPPPSWKRQEDGGKRRPHPHPAPRRLFMFSALLRVGWSEFLAGAAGGTRRGGRLPRLQRCFFCLL